MSDANARTPLYEWHLKHKARMVPFAGWDMPVMYSSIKAEHQAVRTAAGLFDISHMGRLLFTGPDALALVERSWTNHAAAMKPGQVRYGLVCNERGGIKDDILVYRFDHLADNPLGVGPFWMMVVNASNRLKIIEWLGQLAAGLRVEVSDRTHDWGMLAVQGPAAVALMPGVSGLKNYYAALTTAGAIVSRTGYTGEDGFELIVPAADLPRAADDLVERSGGQLLPCGLGSRDTLRLEAAMPLYGHELGEDIDPFQAGLGWAVKMIKGDFVGRDALAARTDHPLPVRVGLELSGRRIARETCPVLCDGHPVGSVTSGTLSPTLERSLAMAYVAPHCAAAGTELTIDVRGTPEAARVVPLPFYKRPAPQTSPSEPRP